MEKVLIVGKSGGSKSALASLVANAFIKAGLEVEEVDNLEHSSTIGGKSFDLVVVDELIENSDSR